MTALREICSQDLVYLRKFAYHAKRCDSFPQLGELLRDSMKGLVGCDYFAWHEVEKNFLFRPIDIRFTATYQDELFRLSEAMEQVLSDHPVWNEWKVNGIEYMTTKTISDYVSTCRFEENPLYREAYRYLNSRFQMGILLPELEDRWINFCVNRQSRDFSKRERQLVDALARIAAPVIEDIAALQKRNRLIELQKRVLGDLVGHDIRRSLAPRQLAVLPGLVQGQTYGAIARDVGVTEKTVEHYASDVYRVLHVDNRLQLASLFAVTKDG